MPSLFSAAMTDGTADLAATNILQRPHVSRHSSRAVLRCLAWAQAEIRAIARQASEEVQILQLRNSEDIADIKEHKSG